MRRSPQSRDAESQNSGPLGWLSLRTLATPSRTLFSGSQCSDSRGPPGTGHGKGGPGRACCSFGSRESRTVQKLGEDCCARLTQECCSSQLPRDWSDSPWSQDQVSLPAQPWATAEEANKKKKNKYSWSRLCKDSLPPLPRRSVSTASPQLKARGEKPAAQLAKHAQLGRRTGIHKNQLGSTELRRLSA